MENGYKVLYHHVLEGSGLIPSATVVLGIKGENFRNAADGTDSIDALCKAVDKITGLGIPHKDRKVVPEADKNIAGIGTAFRYRSEVVYDGKTFIATGADFNKYRAALLAYVNSINKILAAQLHAQESPA